MKTSAKTRRAIGTITLILGFSACSLQSDDNPRSARSSNAYSPIEIVTTELAGDSPLDLKLRRLQERAIENPNSLNDLEQLGWTFVEKARLANDPGYYQLALQSALAISETHQGSAEASLLRGHALHALHRFSEAEREARSLVERRGLAFDHGLLGDILLDRGDVDGAAKSYQTMMDLKPDSHAFMRAGSLRYVIGDVEGARQATRSAAHATSPRRPEAFAWAWSQLARYQLELGEFEGALQSTHHALSVHETSPNAWLQQGRWLLAHKDPTAAVDALSQAAAELDSPEILWALSEALEESGQAAEAMRIHEELRGDRESRDARGLSLYLASRGDQVERALELARQEIAQRQDPFTWDALAWAMRANGDLAGARESMRRALDTGIRNARILLHAGVIAGESGDPDAARKWLIDADDRRHMLLPSELAHLESYFETPRSTNHSS